MERVTRKPTPKWLSLDVYRPKNGAFKRAFFAPSFLLPSSLFFLMRISVEIIAARFAKKLRKVKLQGT